MTKNQKILRLLAISASLTAAHHLQASNKLNRAKEVSDFDREQLEKARIKRAEKAAKHLKVRGAQ